MADNKAQGLPLSFADVSLEDDLQQDETLSESDAGAAVVYSTDWTTETIIGQLAKGNIDVKPRFQRRDAWTLTYKSRFIESLVLGMPVPQIVLAERKEKKGQYIVLDGKQRLLSLLQFAGKSEDNKSGFQLVNLTVAKRLNGVTYNELEETPTYEQDLNAFQNATIRAVVIRNWPSSDYLDLVFVRLNSNSVPLSPQELRQALLPGPFITYIDKASAETSDLQKLLGNVEPDFRMRDVEILLRHLAFRMNMGAYKGNLKQFLDNFCSQQNSSWASTQTAVENEVEEFRRSLAFGFLLFGDDFGRKWTGDRFETRPNRAVIDVLAYYFSDEDVRKASKYRPRQVKDAFKAVCEIEDFKGSVEQTTKSLDAVRKRFGLWAVKLGDTLGMEIVLPNVGQ